MKADSKTKAATFAAGCFWGVEEAFHKVPGVVETEVGYSGGNVPRPTYERVCSGDTGHAEAVRIYFDPNKVSYQELLDIFWQIHDPTQEGGQGLDIGEQYRSVIFYHNEEQHKLAEESKDRLEASGKYEKEIITEIIPAPDFHPAEEYHQKYFVKQAGKPV